jgi:hypothetical protein
MKRKIITLPMCRVEDQQIPLPEFRALVRNHRAWEEEVKQQEVAAEISDFEHRIFHATKRPPRLAVTPLDPVQVATLRRFLPQPITPQADRIPRPVRVLSRPMSTTVKTAVINQPATWNILDEPLVPARPIPCGGLRMWQSRAFAAAGPSGRLGIPTFSVDMQNRAERKLNEYRNSVKYLETCDNQKQEERIRRMVVDDRLAHLEKRKEQQKECADLGQEWAMKALGRIPPKKVKEVIPPPSAEEEEAMRGLTRRDEDLMDLYREKKKERQRLVQKNTSTESIDA